MFKGILDSQLLGDSGIFNIYQMMNKASAGLFYLLLNLFKGYFQNNENAAMGK